MRIEILTFEGCPNKDEALDRVRRALDEEPTAARIDELRFLGSPSVRVNGHDIESGADKRTEFGLMCRTYLESGHIDGTPSLFMIRAAIRRHLKVD